MTPCVETHRIGVILARAGQREADILSNEPRSPRYSELLLALGEFVRLRGSSRAELYAGGLDTSGGR